MTFREYLLLMQQLNQPSEVQGVTEERPPGVPTTTSPVPTAPTTSLPTGPIPPASCAPGTFSVSGSTPCSQAPIGTYVPGSRATTPTACPANTTTLAVGSTSSADCVQVPAFAWNQTFPPTVGQSLPFSRTITSAASGTVRFNCTGSVSSVGAGGFVMVYNVRAGVTSAPFSFTTFPRGAFLPCGETLTLSPSAASVVFEVGSQLRLETTSLSFPAGTTLTVSMRGGLGGGPTEVIGVAA